MRWIKAAKEDSIDKAIVGLYKKVCNPKRKDIEKLALELNISPNELEVKIYEFIGKFLNFGRANQVENIDYNQKQLDIGTQVELEEHTISFDIAERIAKDHLVEIPDYYDWLMEMEEKAHKELNKGKE